MGFFDIFRKSVKKTKQSLSLELDSFSGKITFDTLEELEEILILADVGVTTAGKICSRLGERIKRRNIDSTELRENLCEIVTELMEPDEPLVTETKPSVVLVVGVNGVGKTTSIGKLAYWLQGQGKKVLLGAADTFRAAAGEQLGVWAERVGCQMIKHAEGADPAAVVYDSITAAKARNVDVLICDTAGRLHTKKNLMEELAKIDRVLEREAPGCSRETLLVLDATTGQNGLNQAREFAAACGVTGIILTKLDGTAKGGVAIAIRDQLGLPIKFVGTGESIGDLTPFSAAEFAQALLLNEDEE
ncbi:MAG: signal recognition particle-docking protein FtsY [Ruminococcaceae bacterium]|jgi:signal recognition particle-docking protein ftsY|uniref:signal recognition particle-docking protein FtsY n=1 Tax=Angelakisella sp. TaxID=1935177 RepID=UPI0015A6E77A|nr:signal recognition particle-docking protein FtsY [Oscillospiraceae bacterium]MBS1478317.1 signal recognition particle-docking protein FtsY [Angelakisella sp.]MBS6849963.1 signal recognition particle-docking protein FtsY [Clostridiales bacterium]